MFIYILTMYITAPTAMFDHGLTYSLNMINHGWLWFTLYFFIASSTMVGHGHPECN